MSVNDRSRSETDPATEVARIELSCGSFDALCARRFARRFPPHFHDTYAIGVIESGAVRLRTPRGEWVASGGTILAFAPGEVHSAEPLTDSGWTYRMVYPDVQLMREIGVAPTDEERGAPIFALPVIADAALGTVLARAHRPLMTGESNAGAEARLVRALRTLASCYAGRQASAEVAPHVLRAVEMARAYFHAQVAEPVRLSAVAELCGVSPFHLIRVFRRVLGVTPYAYLVQLRINRAQVMLHDDVNVAEVAYACGFSDQSHLTRVFKKAVGVAPGQYVRSVRARRPGQASATSAR